MYANPTTGSETPMKSVTLPFGIESPTAHLATTWQLQRVKVVNARKRKFRRAPDVGFGGFALLLGFFTGAISVATIY